MSFKIKFKVDGLMKKILPFLNIENRYLNISLKMNSDFGQLVLYIYEKYM